MQPPLLVLLLLCSALPYGPSPGSAETSSSNFANVDPVGLERPEVVASLGRPEVTAPAAEAAEVATEGARFRDPNLHPEHYRYFFNRQPQEAENCRLDPSCPHKDQLDTAACWGYEEGCTTENMSGYPKMEKLVQWCKTEEYQLRKFWDEVDFGYVKKILQDGWYPICTAKTPNGSSVVCTENMHACQAKNFLLDLTDFKEMVGQGRFDVEYLHSPGRIGGHCTVNKPLLSAHSKHYSPLQSWYGELMEYTDFATDPFVTSECDTVVEGRTYMMKLDAGINMFHHFCDFVNLYITQHLMNDFSTNITIVMWDMSGHRYTDFFRETWSVFTDRPLSRLSDWSGKKVCFRDAVFALPPRMIRGFFYNMPVVPDTHDSSLMRAFSLHVLHRLDIKQSGPLKSRKVRVTILDRKTAHRNIVNQDELVEALRADPNYEVQVVVYKPPLLFTQQIELTHNSDIFIGMHGAGLTHLLFLPDWAAIFELCNCEDKHCYQDLANLRGVRYQTWEDTSLLQKHNEVLHPSLKVYHPKFCDYSFDVAEFVRLVKKAHRHVLSHPKFLAETLPRDEL